MMQNRFNGRRVLVTGAAQGIGRRIAERFTEEGAEVIGLDLIADATDATFRQITLDITDVAAVEAVSKAIEKEWGGLDILVNAAGILRLGDSESLTPQDWNACMDVNAAGPFYLLRQWSGVFKRQRRGAIVNIASNAAVVPRIGMLA
jgi:2,3-dihydro-2,3-dihydroxybenzoate dehydrogenase